MRHLPNEVDTPHHRLYLCGHWSLVRSSQADSDPTENTALVPLKLLLSFASASLSFRPSCCRDGFLLNLSGQLVVHAHHRYFNGFIRTMANNAAYLQLPIMVRKPKMVWPGLVKEGRHLKSIAGDGKLYSHTTHGAW